MTSNETGKSGETGRTEVESRKGLLDRVETAAIFLAVVSLIGVVAVQAWQVFARYVLNSSPSWTEPLALFLIGITAMFGAAVGVRRETHFSFSTLADAAPPAVKAACKAISRAAMILLGGGLAFYGAILTKNSWGVPMAGVDMPVGMRFAPVALGGVLITVFAVERFVRAFFETPQPASEPVVSAEM